MSQLQSASEPDPEPSGRSDDLRNLVRALDGTGDPGTIHLLCIRPAGDFERFDARLAILAARYRDVRITFAHVAQAVLPSVLLVRAGEIVGEAIGDLPLRELDEVVRAAATWPAAVASAA